jgi:adenylyl-sulfate kinase
MEQKGVTIWFTGLSGSGKTTLARMLETELRRRGYERIEVLDGDAVRTHLSKGLGFSREDRDTNIRRIGFVCKLLTRNGVIAIASAISPYRETRDANRKEIGDFIEVYCKCDVESCIRRDVKGFYKKALDGEVKQFTGIDDPYEEPLNPEVTLETDRETPGESLCRLMQALERRGIVSPEGEEVYTEEEEEKVRKRLEDLGYL